MFGKLKLDHSHSISGRSVTNWTDAYQIIALVDYAAENDIVQSTNQKSNIESSHPSDRRLYVQWNANKYMCISISAQSEPIETGGIRGTQRRSVRQGSGWAQRRFMNMQINGSWLLDAANPTARRQSAFNDKSRLSATPPTDPLAQDCTHGSLVHMSATRVCK